MEACFKYEQGEREKFIISLTNKLPVLRAQAAITQEDLAVAVGITRQTYNSIENRSRTMSWNTYMALILYFHCNPLTHDMLLNLVDLSDEAFLTIQHPKN